MPDLIVEMIYPETTKFVVSHNADRSVIHYSEVTDLNRHTTPYPFVEVFDTEEEMMARVNELQNEREIEI